MKRITQRDTTAKNGTNQLLSTVRFTDWIVNASVPSDESLGYFQASAPRTSDRSPFLVSVINLTPEFIIHAKENKHA